MGMVFSKFFYKAIAQLDTWAFNNRNMMIFTRVDVYSFDTAIPSEPDHTNAFVSILCYSDPRVKCLNALLVVPRVEFWDEHC